jgi:hypothetical protein
VRLLPPAGYAVVGALLRCPGGWAPSVSIANVDTVLDLLIVCLALTYWCNFLHLEPTYQVRLLTSDSDWETVQKVSIGSSVVYK